MYIIKNILIFILLSAVLLTVALPYSAHAQEETTSLWDSIRGELNPVEDVFGGPPPDIREVIARILRVFMSILGMIYLIIVVYGGFMWMTAAGNEDKILKARSTIVHGAIGVGIIVGAFAITRFVVIVLGCSVQTTARFCLFFNNLGY